MCNILWYRYLIKDLNGQRQYLLDVTLTVCFSDSPSCEIRNKILQHYLVTKPVCAWYTGFTNPGICNLHWCIHLHSWWIGIYINIPFKIPTQRKTCQLNLLFLSTCICLTVCWLYLQGFSYASWLNANNIHIPTSESLNGLYLPKLLEALGISKYIKVPSCDKEKGIYRNSFNGWNSGLYDAVNLCLCRL